MSSILEKTLRFLNKIFNLTPKLISYSVSKRSFLLTRYVNKIQNVDIVVGHNPGALYATYWTANKFKCRSGFDVEDYHPGEGNNNKQQQLLLQLMKRFLPEMDYVSFAAPLIKDEIIKNVSFTAKTNLPIVLNYFSKNDFNIDSLIINQKIKLVWFSQNIDFDRGLESVIPILEKHKNLIEFHLYGNLSKNFEKKILHFTDFIKFHGTTNQNILYYELKYYDIGLALEPGKDLNNLLAISNKILCFFQSGLYILSTDTPAQKLFLNEHPNHGITFNMDFSNFEDTLILIIENISKIRMEKSKRFNDSRNYNWENESVLVLKNWNNN